MASNTATLSTSIDLDFVIEMVAEVGRSLGGGGGGDDIIDRPGVDISIGLQVAWFFGDELLTEEQQLDVLGCLDAILFEVLLDLLAPGERRTLLGRHSAAHDGSLSAGTQLSDDKQHSNSTTHTLSPHRHTCGEHEHTRHSDATATQLATITGEEHRGFTLSLAGPVCLLLLLRVSALRPAQRTPPELGGSPPSSTTTPSRF